MPRSLKTYVTTSGFFELAVAAPSMKAALALWGSNSNLFQKGFARETDDADVVKATLEHPGVVLRRAVGSKGLFSQNAALPTLAALQNAITHKRSAETPAKKPVKKAPAPPRRAVFDPAASRKAAELYDLAEKRRQREEERAEARREKERERQKHAVEKAQAALDEARSRHEERTADIEKHRDALERKAHLENERWQEEEDKLKAALRRAGDE